MKRSAGALWVVALLVLPRAGSADIRAEVPARDWLRQGGALLTLDVVPKSARIEIDGDVQADGPWLVTAGVHMVVVTARGRQGYRAVLHLPAGRRTTRRIELSARPLTGQVDVRTTPVHTRLLVDGRLVGDTPRVVRLDAGRHRLAVASIGYRGAARIVRVPGGATLMVRFTLQAERHRFRRPRWVAALTRNLSR